MKKQIDIELLDRIARRAHYLANQMIFRANHRDNVEKGDPKVGGHSSASASSLHILGALHLVVKSGFDHIANKPHASPADHSYNYLLDLFLKEDLSRYDLDDCNRAMDRLRAFPEGDEPVFQSYHSAYDPDRHNFLPSGTVGIPPVNLGYLAHAYQFAKKQGYQVPDAHFWAIIGDSEFREGSLAEAIPDFAEREIGNLTWIVDYNRQSLDGHRITNKEAVGATDDIRIERTLVANGWEVIQVRHGRRRLELFQKKGGEQLKALLEGQVQDYEIQVLLQLKDGAAIREELLKYHSGLGSFLKQVSDEELYTALHDFGGHDFSVLIEALEKSKLNPRKPTMIIAHTIKGWGLQMAATPGNHSSLPDQAEMEALRENQGIKSGELYERFQPSTPEGAFLKRRGESLYADILKQHEIRQSNLEKFAQQQRQDGEMPQSLNINLKMATYPHTQWMLGQLTAKLTRIANTPEGGGSGKPLSADEKPFRLAGQMLIPMAPDVGTSTNLNPTMDGKIFGAPVDDMESEFGVKDTKTPDLVPGREVDDRFLRFDIAEANVMSCMGSYGRMRETLGIPLLPLMTVYDFFVKRAHDQFFYDLYWKSSFICVGTPSGVTLSPEGAQHGWKSDFQIPNQVTWEPFYCVELDWILTDAIQRHLQGDNEGRNGVFIRGVTRGVDQKSMLKNLKSQLRFKTNRDVLLHPESYVLAGATVESEIPAVSDDEILKAIQQDALQGGYLLVDYRGYAGYEPGDNVIHLFAMGAMGTEALKASQSLLEKGIYANVIIVTSPDLLLGNLAAENNYQHLRLNLQIDAQLYVRAVTGSDASHADLLTLAGRRVPVVSVHDGEAGLLDNIGSVVGVRHLALAVRKHSRSGRPSDVYRYHHIDADAIVVAAEQVLQETALEQIQIKTSLMGSH